MRQVENISGRGVPVVGNDIDTDRIIPARFLRCVTFEGLGEQAFADDRTQAEGKHPFDSPQYQGANILVVNGNFGCGSSREHAPQALSKWGIEAIVGESFAEIFFGNCVAIGIPCVTAASKDVEQLQKLIQQHPQATLRVDLAAMHVESEEFRAPIQMAQGPRQMLTTGTWDNCGQLVTNVEQVRTTAAKLPYLSWNR